MKTNLVYYALLLLAVEKLVQHIFVTLALYFNWGNIASSVVVSPAVLIILGALVAVLFAVSLWGLLRKQPWTIDLLIALAVFDIVGEFVAQGTLMIAVPVSFLVAVLLLILSLVYRRQMRAA